MSNASALVALLDDQMMEELEHIARVRAPSEAVGVLVDVAPPHRQSRCIELPNRSPTHHENAEIHTADLRLALEGWVGQTAAIWHSHPGGLVGPSQGDMETRKRSLPELGYLVVTLTDEGSVVTWY